MLLSIVAVSIYFPTNSKRASFSPHTLQHLLFVDFFSDGHSACLSAVLSWTFPIISDVKSIFVCLLATCMSFFDKCLSKSSPHFLIGLFVFLILSWMSCLYTLETHPLSVASFAISSSHSKSCYLILFIISFAVKEKAFKVNYVLLVYFSFYSHYFKRWVKEDLTVKECTAYIFL